MSLLGVVEGKGRILVEGKDWGEVRYHISVYRPQPQGLKEQLGTIRGDDEAIWAAHQNRSATLVLEGGENVKILLTHVSPGSGRAEMRVNGSIPGF